MDGGGWGEIKNPVRHHYLTGFKNNEVALLSFYGTEGQPADDIPLHEPGDN